MAVGGARKQHGASRRVSSQKPVKPDPSRISNRE